jgi:hypothetical protein
MTYPVWRPNLNLGLVYLQAAAVSGAVTRGFSRRQHDSITQISSPHAVPACSRLLDYATLKDYDIICSTNLDSLEVLNQLVRTTKPEESVLEKTTR